MEALFEMKYGQLDKLGVKMENQRTKCTILGVTETPHQSGKKETNNMAMRDHDFLQTNEF